MKLEKAEEIRNKCFNPIFKGKEPIIEICKGCPLFKRIVIKETQEAVLICEAVTDYLKVKIATENFLTLYTTENKRCKVVPIRHEIKIKRDRL